MFSFLSKSAKLTSSFQPLSVICRPARYMQNFHNLAGQALGLRENGLREGGEFAWEHRAGVLSGGVSVKGEPVPTPFPCASAVLQRLSCSGPVYK